MLAVPLLHNKEKQGIGGMKSTEEELSVSEETGRVAENAKTGIIMGALRLDASLFSASAATSFFSFSRARHGIAEKKKKKRHFLPRSSVTILFFHGSSASGEAVVKSSSLIPDLSRASTSLSFKSSHSDAASRTFLLFALLSHSPSLDWDVKNASRSRQVKREKEWVASDAHSH